MTSRLFALSILAVLAGCLPDDSAVDGRLLFAGIGIESPGFSDPSMLNGEPWVFFSIRSRRREGDLFGEVDLHRVSWEDGRQQLVVAGVSERPEWSNHETDSQGATYYMLNERPAATGGRSVGTLARVTLDEGVVETLEDVLSYQMHGSRQRFLYRKYVPDSNLAELHIRDVTGADRNLGPLSGVQVQFVGQNRMYWVRGTDRTMMRMVGWDAEPQPLRGSVSRFELQYQEKLAVITVSEPPKVRTLILNLETLKERPLPVENHCCWQGLRGNTVTFSESATATSPGKLHTYDILSEKHDVLVLPEGLADVSSIVPRQPFTDSLVTDSKGQIAVMRPGSPTTFELLSLKPKAMRFTSDGKHLIYIQEDPKPPPPAVSSTDSGRLMAQDAESWDLPPILLSPPGSSVRITPNPGFLLPGERPRQVIFWAQYGLGASDLYLIDLDTRQTLKLAVGIGAVAIGGRNVLGVVRITQDLTGDLVHRDFLTGDEQLIEHSVAAATTRDDAVHGPIVAFVVRERMASSPRNGLWAAPLKLLAPPEERENTLRVPETTEVWNPVRVPGQMVPPP